MKTELLKWKDAANTGKSAIKIIEAQLISFMFTYSCVVEISILISWKELFVNVANWT